MNMSDFKEVDDKFIEKNFNGTDVVDLGEVTVNCAREYEMLLKYIEALKNGDETYKPAGLEFVKPERGGAL